MGPAARPLPAGAQTNLPRRRHHTCPQWPAHSRPPPPPPPRPPDVLKMDQSRFLIDVSPRPSATCASLSAPGRSCSTTEKGKREVSLAWVWGVGSAPGPPPQLLVCAHQHRMQRSTCLLAYTRMAASRSSSSSRMAWNSSRLRGGGWGAGKRGGGRRGLSASFQPRTSAPLTRGVPPPLHIWLDAPPPNRSHRPRPPPGCSLTCTPCGPPPPLPHPHPPPPNLVGRRSTSQLSTT